MNCLHENEMGMQSRDDAAESEISQYSIVQYSKKHSETSMRKTSMHRNGIDEQKKTKTHHTKCAV